MCCVCFVLIDCIGIDMMILLICNVCMSVDVVFDILIEDDCIVCVGLLFDVLVGCVIEDGGFVLVLFGFVEGYMYFDKIYWGMLWYCN